MITSYEIFVPVIMGSGSSMRTGMKVREMGCLKALVIYDKGMKDTGIADRILDSLHEAGLETVIFDGVVPDPPDTMVEAAAEEARKAGVDSIVAVGGGSAIDTAKGVNVLINNPPPLSNYCGGVQNGLKPGLKMVFIPTTSGTGSEVTNMCVISLVTQKKKDSVVSPVCLADLAIVDPDLTLGLPPKMTAATGVDAFAHAVESLTGGQANPMADALAREAIRMIVKWLPIAIEDGKNLEAREHMILASTFAGMAFTNALVHMGHSIGHTFGALFHLPHGIACSLALPEVICYTAKTEAHKVREICDCMGVEVPADADNMAVGEIAREAIRGFLKKTGMPNMKALDIPKAPLGDIAKAVTQDIGYAIIPYRISASKVHELLLHAYDA